MWFDADRDAHAGGYWYFCFNTGRDAYRQAVEAGQHLGVRTAGTGTTSATTPLVAVGNQPCTGQNPPKFLNAEFNWLLVLNADGQWVEATDAAALRFAAQSGQRAPALATRRRRSGWRPAVPRSAAGDVVLQATEITTARRNGRCRRTRATWLTRTFGEITLAERVTQSTKVELRMAVAGRTGFGGEAHIHAVVE